MIDYTIFDKFNLPHPELMSDEELRAFRDVFSKVIDHRKALKMNREKQEIVGQMNKLLREFSRIRRAQLNIDFELGDNGEYDDIYGTSAFVQDCDDFSGYRPVGAYDSAVYGFTIDEEGDLMVVIDPNNPISDWGN